MISQEETVNLVTNSNELFDLFHFVQKMDLDASFERIADIGYPEESGLNTSDDMRFYKIEKLSYDEEYPRREAFENVLDSLDNEAFNFVYVLSGSITGVDLHIGVVKNHRTNIKAQTMQTSHYGDIIKSSFEGNFSGSLLRQLDSDEIQEKILRQTKKYKSAGIISGIPSINESDAGEEFDFQGIDRLINSMLGQTWRIVVVCEPVSQAEILKIKDDIYELYNRLSVYSKA